MRRALCPSLSSGGWFNQAILPLRTSGSVWRQAVLPQGCRRQPLARGWRRGTWRSGLARKASGAAVQAPWKGAGMSPHRPRFSVGRDWWVKPLAEAAVSGLRVLCCWSRPTSMRAAVMENPHRAICPVSPRVGPVFPSARRSSPVPPPLAASRMSSKEGAGLADQCHRGFACPPSRVGPHGSAE